MIYLGLVHHPIKNKIGQTVTTSVTNLDIHDISRSCRTFGIQRYFIITPIEAQHELLRTILGHWEADSGSAYNPDRSDALSVAHAVYSIEQSISEIEKETKEKPVICVTGANFESYDGTIKDMQSKFNNRPILLLFGTGWGLAKEVLEMADYHVEPIVGLAKDQYNHLSVRSAVAIYLSQLC